MNRRQSPGGGMVLDFRDHIAAYAEAVKKSIGQCHKAVTIRLFSAVIMGTPVDTGEAAGGWVYSMGKIVHGPSGRLGAVPADNALRAAVTTSIDEISFLSNSVEHITGLEFGTHSYGFSKKAPQGMVRINVLKFQRLVSEEIAKARTAK